MTYTVDIAGFYYKRSGIVLGANPTVEDVMQEASKLDKAGRAAGGNNPLLQFMVEPGAHKFLSTISVHHVGRAVSRQTSLVPKPTRSYGPGEYVFSDDPVREEMDTAGNVYFVAIDHKGNPTGDPFVRTWQYYLYDQSGTDLARSTTVRTVNPFGVTVVPPNTTIVWRAVLIGIAPSWRPGQKG
jgi:hypothetical protein